MTRVKEPHLGCWQIPFVCLSANRKKERIILAPDGQERRLEFAEILLKLWVKIHVGRVILEKIELHLVGIGTSQVKIVQRTAIGRYQTRVGNAVRVLERR